jgi:methanogenic corrinoid protein MtbC1
MTTPDLPAPAPREPDPLVLLLADLEEEAAVERVRQRLAAGEAPARILEDCQEGLVVVGDRYREGTYFIAGLIMAGEIFREAMELLGPTVVAEHAGPSAGTVLICTVHGDIHDLGKNLLVMLLQSVGYEVRDLGVDVPTEEIVRAVLESPPDVLGLSGMLQTSFPAMRATIAAVHAATAERGFHVPIIVGGGQLAADTAAWVGADGWSNSAGTGVTAIAELIEGSRHKGGQADPG